MVVVVEVDALVGVLGSVSGFSSVPTQ